MSDASAPRTERPLARTGLRGAAVEHHGSWVRVATMLATGGYLASILASVLAGAQHFPLLYEDLAALTLCAIATVLAFRGRTHVATYLALGSIWLEVHSAVILHGGPDHSAALPAFPAIVVCSGLLLGSRAAMAVGGVTMLTFPLAAVLGRLHAGAAVDPSVLLYSVIMDVVLAGLVVLTSLFLASFDQALSSARESDERFRLFMDNNPAVAFMKDEDGRYVYVSAAFERANNARAEDYLGKTDFEIIPEHLARQLREYDLEVLATGRVHEYHETVQTPGGEPLNAWVFKFPFTDAGGRRFLAAVGFDETARVRAERALKDSQHRFQAIFDQTFQLIGLLDTKGVILEANRTALDFAGVRAEDVVGKPFWDTAWWRGDPDGQETLRQAIARAAAGEFVRFETVHHDKEGHPHSVDFSLKPVRDADGKVVLLIPEGRDITEHKEAEAQRRELEAQVRHSQKLESLGVLAGGIAHDFNNLLTSVLGYAELAGMELPPGSPVQAHLAEIGRGARRAAELTQQMLAYSGRGSFVIQSQRLDALVREMSTLLGTVVSKKVAMHLDLKPATIEADAAQMRQIVMNLITNASDAFEGQAGTIHVRTVLRDMPAGSLKSPFLQQEPPPGRYAMLEVKDGGIGMDAETMGRIFDPFFSTKFSGRGLGLAAVLGIVRGHRGTLQVDSAPGRGTTFRVFIPAAHEALHEAAPAAAAGPRDSGRGTILVVDDEAAVRGLVERALRMAGYSVLTAGDGQEGLDLFAQHQDTVRAMVLDLTMPRMDGWEIFEHIRRARPGLPILLISGYSDPEVPAHTPSDRAPDFLQKPFQVRDLIDRVQRLTS